jgi:DNA-binding transcriptional MerR regulator
MATLVTIGNFSRMTYLSIKALRYYHEVGLLEPADVEPTSGYRLYRPEQVATAQVIRRLRDLDMPLEDIRAVLDAKDVTGRNAVIVEHLRRMERQLEQTQATVSSLRALLEQHEARIEVEYRIMPTTRAIAVRRHIAMADAEQWSAEAFRLIQAALDEGEAERTGPDAALYYSEFFTEEVGEVVAFVPVLGDARPAEPVHVLELAAAEFAVTVHEGPSAELDKTYGALGAFVSERAIGVEGPIRENYLVTTQDLDDEARSRTEVCWPVFHTTK